MGKNLVVEIPGETVELIYFQGCPSVPLARERLSQAFAWLGMTPNWHEWDRNAPDAPRHTRAYGSPTILVNGKDVTGMEPSCDDVGSCRVYVGEDGMIDGAPSVAIIAAALRGGG